jgi:hypothetical protein
MEHNLDQSGYSLSRKEMKKIRGGFTPPPTPDPPTGSGCTGCALRKCRIGADCSAYVLVTTSATCTTGTLTTC